MWMYPESVFVYFETWLWACWHIQSVPCHPGNYHPLGKVPTLPINTAFLTLIAYVGVPFINTSGAYAVFGMKAQHQLHCQLCYPNGNAWYSCGCMTPSWLYMDISLSCATDDWFKRQTAMGQQYCWGWSGKAFGMSQRVKDSNAPIFSNTLFLPLTLMSFSHYSGFKSLWWI